MPSQEILFLHIESRTPSKMKSGKVCFIYHALSMGKRRYIYFAIVLYYERSICSKKTAFAKFEDALNLIEHLEMRNCSLTVPFMVWRSSYLLQHGMCKKNWTQTRTTYKVLVFSVYADYLILIY